MFVALHIAMSLISAPEQTQAVKQKYMTEKKMHGYYVNAISYFCVSLGYQKQYAHVCLHNITAKNNTQFFSSRKINMLLEND